MGERVRQPLANLGPSHRTEPRCQAGHAANRDQHSARHHHLGDGRGRDVVAHGQRPGRPQRHGGDRLGEQRPVPQPRRGREAGRQVQRRGDHPRNPAGDRVAGRRRRRPPPREAIEHQPRQQGRDHHVEHERTAAIAERRAERRVQFAATPQDRLEEPLHDPARATQRHHRRDADDARELAVLRHARRLLDQREGHQRPDHRDRLVGARHREVAERPTQASGLRRVDRFRHARPPSASWGPAAATEPVAVPAPSQACAG